MILNRIKRLDEKAYYHGVLEKMMAAHATPKTAEWFTNYLKGVITYRGLKTGMLKEVLKEFFETTHLNKKTDQEQLDQIRYWLSKPMAEDKLIAIVWLQQWIKAQIQKFKTSPGIAQVFDHLEDVFEKGDIYDWSTNDWLCVRILETIPVAAPSYVPRLMSWSQSESLWQRRSSILAFKKCGKMGDYHQQIEQLIECLLPSDERFVQTAIGWVLSDASRKHPEWAYELFKTHFDHLSHEVIYRHTKYLPQHQDLKMRSRKRNGAR